MSVAQLVQYIKGKSSLQLQREFPILKKRYWRSRQRHKPLIQDWRGIGSIRWVFVHDLSGTHRDEYFFSTDPEMTPRQIIETFTGRWSIEVTFEEKREYLGLETTRGWSVKTVFRAAPCLFSLYSVVALLYASLSVRTAKAARLEWNGKRTTTFSDAIAAVRQSLRTEWVFETGSHRHAFSKLPRNLQRSLLHALAPAA